MGIRTGVGKSERDWSVLTLAAAEMFAQIAALGPAGLSGAVSAFFRAAERLRGKDNLELRATNLILDTLCYASVATFAHAKLTRRPPKAQARAIVEAILRRARLLMTQGLVELETEHLENPNGFSIFANTASRFAHELRDFGPKERVSDLEARFRAGISLGLHKTRIRAPEYFAPVVEALVGPDATSNARALAWERYRSLLVRRFEDAPLFGEEGTDAVSLGQVYQPLRAWFYEDAEDEVRVTSPEPSSSKAQQISVRVGTLESLVLEWLEADDSQDQIRLISGGPGSGKSTFARFLAASLAIHQRWRVLFVPLQRLRGSGPLESRIDDYFRLHLDEPFGAETPPMATLGRDGHRDWILIFDGLDELAKEGSGAESAAQDFASALADLRARLYGAAHPRYLVLGRAPSMQEARRRLDLGGGRTLHVADMRPLEFQRYSVGGGAKVKVKDPERLASLDQRKEFWSRWAVAKKLPQAAPRAMIEDSLSDLTKEPLLAFLLIKSGYASNRWREAAENRNRIYKAIFEQIWDRERTKETRTHLNDLGKVGFDALMQALGIAAWRGGGRTGDEATFTAIRDAFMRPDLLSRAKSSQVADLDNIAVLFYTQKDEAGGRGYEFLHKSFGEYLTACGLLSAFRRWASQVREPELDFDSMEFLRRWLVLTGPAFLTNDISEFLGNEARLQADEEYELRPWFLGRQWADVVATIFSRSLHDGPPAHEHAVTWRDAERSARNAEVALVVLRAACARVGYPLSLVGHTAETGGWLPGPMRIDEFFVDAGSVRGLFHRLAAELEDDSILEGQKNLAKDFSRLDLTGAVVWAVPTESSFAGSCLDNALLIGSAFSCDFGKASLVRTNLSHSELSHSSFEYADLTDVIGRNSSFWFANLAHSNFRNANLENARFEYADLREVNFAGANMKGVSLANSDISGANFEGAEITSAAKEKALKDGESLEEARRKYFHNPPKSIVVGTSTSTSRR